MARSVIMPKSGMTMEEGTIVRWLKKPGDRVTRGEPIAVIETDKATMDLEAEDDGTLLALVHGDGSVVKATHIIAWIGEPGEKLETATPSSASEAPHGMSADATAAPRADGGGRVPATPAARRLAAEARLALAEVKGTGPGGAARARDVTAAASASTARATPLARNVAALNGIDLATIVGSGYAGRIRRADVEAKAAADSEPAEVSGAPMSGMRRTIADKMLRSHQSVPSVTLVTRADVTELVGVRGKINEGGGAKVSFTDFIVRAAATALRENLLVNSVIEGDRIVMRAEVNVGVAVALDEGLIVPVIRGADRLSVRQVSERLRDLAARARTGDLRPADCTGGTFTITNLGMYGITEFTPLINVPESAILGVGAIEEVLRRGEDGTIVSRQVMSLCLTHDHRHIDGAPAAVFLGRVRALLEHCWALLV